MIPRKTQTNYAADIIFREKLSQILQTTQVQVFKSDPIRWIPQDHVTLYKREISWHLYQMTRLINIECWNIIVNILFEQHSRVIFSLIYQLGGTSYHRSALPFLTGPWENYSIVKHIASIYKTNIILYRPNYIPQYLRVKTHYVNLITPTNQNEVDNTLVMYSEPVEYLFSRDYNFQLSSLTDLRFEENFRTFFELDKCLIEYEAFDKIGHTDDERTNLQVIKEKFDQDKAKARYKAFVALRCDSEASEDVPDDWWPYPDDRPLTIEEFVLLLIKVSTTYSGTYYIIYKNNFYCICGDMFEADTMICQVDDHGGLSIPSDFENRLFGTEYKRGSLLSLVNNKYLFVN